MPRKNSRKKTKYQNRSRPVDSKPQNTRSMSKKTNLEFESTTHSSPELTTDGTKQCSENTPVAQGDILHMIEQAAQSGSPKEMLECFNQLIHTENKVNQKSLDQGLISSCRYGREFLVKILMAHGANIETRDKDGNTPLLICAEKGFTDIALLLVDKGADINSYNKDGDTALLLSIKTSGSSHLIKKILEKEDLNVGHKNKHKYDALMKALEVLNFSLFKKLLAHLSNAGRYTPKHYAQSEHSFTKIGETLGLTSFLSILIQHSDYEKSALKSAVLMKDIYKIKLLLYSQVVDFRSNHGDFDVSIVSEILNSIKKSDRKITKQDLSIIKTLLKAGAPLNSDFRGNEHPLVTAVKLGCYDLVEMFCQHKYLNSSTHMYYRHSTSLAVAAENGRCDIINLLIKHGIGESNMSSALESSLKHGQINCAKLLIEHGANIDAEKALNDIVRNNRVESFLFLRQHFKSDILLKIKRKGSALLNLAASKGHKEIIKLLVQEGADINASYDYKTPLMSTVDVNVMEFLIDIGADVNAKVDRHRDSCSVLEFVLSESKVGRGLDYLLQKIMLLIHNGANVNVRNKKGNTPLIRAAQISNNEEVLRILIRAGADVNQQNNKGESALHLALNVGSISNSKVLLEFKADVDLKAKDGQTPLFYCLWRKNSQMIQLLIENNANVNCERNNGDKPLLYLCSLAFSGEAELVEMLIKAGASVNNHNTEGYTPLMLAAKNESFDVLKLLCDSGAEINVINEEKNETALSILLNMRHDKNLVIYLIEKGADCSCLSPSIIHQLILKKEISCLKHILTLGLGPAELNSDSFDVFALHSISPFVLSLSKGYVNIARFLNDIWFLTQTDVSNAVFNQQFRGLLEEDENSNFSKFIDEYSSQPMSLQKLSFVVVSSAVGADAGRRARVNKLPIPKIFQDKLLFRHAEKSDVKLHADDTDDEVSVLERLLRVTITQSRLRYRTYFPQ